MSSRRLRRLNGLGAKANPINLRNLRLKYPVSSLNEEESARFAKCEVVFERALRQVQPQLPKTPVEGPLGHAESLCGFVLVVSMSLKGCGNKITLENFQGSRS